MFGFVCYDEESTPSALFLSVCIELLLHALRYCCTADTDRLTRSNHGHVCALCTPLSLVLYNYNDVLLMLVFHKHGESKAHQMLSLSQDNYSDVVFIAMMLRSLQ